MKRLGLIAAAVALAGCAGVAVAQNAEGEVPAGPAPQPEQAGPPPQPAQAGPPPMPQPVTMAQRPSATGGEALYVEYCAMCHAANGMGTGLLARRGREPAQLEGRGDLAAGFVVIAARNGIGNMPAVPRGEVSDEQLQAIADYLAAGPHGDVQ